MALSYQDVMAADLSPLLNASELWQKMGNRFAELKEDYEKYVQRAMANGKWQGQAFTAHQNSSAATASEYAAAKTEALAVASLLKQAHTELTRLQKAVKDLVAEAEAKDYKVDGSGRATYVGFSKLSAQEQSALHHDPDYPQLVAQAQQVAQEWTDGIAKAVRAVDEADQGVQRALSSAVAIGNGFNAHAEGDLTKAATSWSHHSDSRTRVDGKVKVTGPDVGFKVTSDPKYGKEGSVKANIDLYHVTAEVSESHGPMKLSGIVDAYGGARATANYGFNQKGVAGKAEASIGHRATVEGRAGLGQVGGYARAEGFSGAEIGVNAKATKEEVTVGAKSFAGEKGTVAWGAEVGGIGIGSTAEGWSGPGAEAWWGYKKDEKTGVWKLGGKAGGSPVVGGAVGFEITVDPHKVTKAAGDVADAVGDAFDAVGDAAGSAKKAVSSWF
ncbi:hypothetical protein ABZ442_19065 [Streptomyces triculaminicus]|uniref:hypothetical protein n=1 Tax=Streptomyces triculaminicus TaxID=2816232 RepID=UPI0033C7AB76